MDNALSRRLNKKAQRQQRWQERQERSRCTREEMDNLRTRREELRRRLDDQAASESDANAVNLDKSNTFVKFTDLPLSQRTLMGLERGNYTLMTPIQREALHLALAGYDVLGAAKTGSGKTLCFVIPVLERLVVEHWDTEMGVGAILLSPTRELALQIFKVMQVVGYKHVLSAALLTGGRDVAEERRRLHVISIIVGTPGRVLHHLQDASDLTLDNLQLFCMDEADRLLDMGFREALTSILTYLPPQRQTLLFSATQSTDVQMLAQTALHAPRYVSTHGLQAAPTPSTLCQNFLIVELHRKLDVLHLFLKKHPHDKIVVFVSTCNQVKYMYLTFSRILKKTRIPSMCLTSKMKQFRREEVFLTFCRCKSAVLFCTDVAARGLDFPLVHWVVQYDCPESAQTYIHRAGRTARAGARGVSVLFLTPSETPMLAYLAHKNLMLREIAVKPYMLHSSHDIFVALVVQGLKYEAQKAFIAYLRALSFASNKHVFNIAKVDLEAFAKSLGLLVVPDLTELQQTARRAKNLPWDVANYLARQQKDTRRLPDSSGGTETTHAESIGDRPSADRRDGALPSPSATSVAASGPDEGEPDAEQSALPAHSLPLTRKEKHLQASDMFRTLAMKQERFATKTVLHDGDNESDDEDDFFIKKKSTPPAGVVEPHAAAAESSSSLSSSVVMPAPNRLTAEERLAGLSKSKRRKFVEAADLRVRDLNLNTRIVFHDDDEEDEDENGERGEGVTADAQAAEVHAIALHSDRRHTGEEAAAGYRPGAEDASATSGDVSETEEAFTQRLRRRVEQTRSSDGTRAKQLRRLRRLQKEGKVSRKATVDGEDGGRLPSNRRRTRETSGDRSKRQGGDSHDDEGCENDEGGTAVRTASARRARSRSWCSRRARCDWAVAPKMGRQVRTTRQGCVWKRGASVTMKVIRG